MAIIKGKRVCDSCTCEALPYARFYKCPACGYFMCSLCRDKAVRDRGECIYCMMPLPKKVRELC